MATLVIEKPNGEVKKVETTYSLLLADKEAIKTFWPTFIRPALLKIKEPIEVRGPLGKTVVVPAKDKNSGTWLPEHVRAHIEAGLMGRIFCECYLIIPSNKGGPVGFVVLKSYPDEFAGIPLSLFVWIAYSKAPIGKVFPHVLPQLEKHGRDLGLTNVFGITSRLAWGRRLAKYGYKLHQVIYRKGIV